MKNKIILKEVGRAKVSKTIEVEGELTEEELAQVAYKECSKHIMSTDRWLEPDEEKGDGFWKVFAGMGYHVGDVEIKMNV